MTENIYDIVLNYETGSRLQTQSAQSAQQLVVYLDLCLIGQIAPFGGAG